jgi:hypothetical protein
MPETPAELHERVMAASDDEGRLPLSRMTGWEIFPFEREGLRVVRLQPPRLPEPPRRGEAGSACDVCAAADEPNSSDSEIWRDDRWRLEALQQSGVPLLLMLKPLAHHDLTDLPDDLARELGVLMVHIARAVESLPHVARCHVSKWGDGGAHLHLFFYARPEGFQQLRGTCLAVWDDLLPATPDAVRAADARAVADALARSYGGRPL